jgi:hypothetical protein
MAIFFYGIDHESSAKSNGHRIFIDLFETASSLGFPVVSVQPGELVSLSDKDICIYTDSFLGNPLGARNVVRFFLARPLSLSFDASQRSLPCPFGTRDLLYSYSTFVDPYLPQCFFLSATFEDLLNRSLHLNPRKVSAISKICIYYGKTYHGSRYFAMPSIRSYFPGASISPITRYSPSSKFQLYSELQSSDLLVTFDPLTNLIAESLLLRTPVWIIDDTYRLAYSSCDLELDPVFYDHPSVDDYRDRLFRFDSFVNSVLTCRAKKGYVISRMIEACLAHFSSVDDSLELLNANHRINLAAWTRYVDSATSVSLVKGITLPRIKDVGLFSHRFWVAFIRLSFFRLHRLSLAFLGMSSTFIRR